MRSVAESLGVSEDRIWEQESGDSAAARLV